MIETVPVPAGATALTRAASIVRTLVAALAPKWTAVAPVRFVPVIVTRVPPATGPKAGLTAVTEGFTPVVMPVTWTIESPVVR